nr:MAG TPA: structural protein [Caudoviricetes sp.]
MLISLYHLLSCLNYSIKGASLKERGRVLRRRISKVDFEEFISKNFNSKLEFSKELNISYSHLDSILNGKVLIGDKVNNRLSLICEKLNVEVEDLLECLPLGNIKEIIVTRDDELIAYMSSTSIIEKDGFKIVCVPYVLKD